MFYCGKTCTTNFGHPDRKTFEVVSTKDTKTILVLGTLKIYSSREVIEKKY